MGRLKSDHHWVRVFGSRIIDTRDPRIGVSKMMRSWGSRAEVALMSLFSIYVFILLIICCNYDYLALRLSGQIFLLGLYVCPWDISAGLGVDSQQSFLDDEVMGEQSGGRSYVFILDLHILYYLIYVVMVITSPSDYRGRYPF